MDDVDTNHITPEQAAAYSGVYHLLGRLWLREVDVELADQLNQPPLRDTFESAGGTLPATPADELECLAIDFCQLFLGPKNHLPPFQSVWQAGQFNSGAVDSMREFIEIARYEHAALTDDFMLDHLGIQLDLMGYLFFHLSATCVNTSRYEATWQIIHAFSTAHLNWTTRLLTAAKQQAKTPFYVSVIQMTGELLDTTLPH